MEEQFVDQLDPTYKGNIWCTPRTRHEWRVYLTELGDDLKNHIETLDMIRTAPEDDIIEVLITTPGGRCDLADMYLSAFRDSQAQIITRAIGECSSAGTTIFLAGDVREVEDGCYFMFHNVQLGGVGGDSANVFSRTKFYERLFREKSYAEMAEVLTKEEMSELFDRAGEVYLTAEEMRERLKKADEQRPTEAELRRGCLVPPLPGDGLIQGICNHDTFGDSPRTVQLREVVNAGALEAMKKVGLVELPFPKTPVKTAAEFPHGDEFEVTLDEGYSQMFRLSTLCPGDFDAYNLAEIVEIGEAFGIDLGGFTRPRAILTLIDEMLDGGGA